MSHHRRTPAELRARYPIFVQTGLIAALILMIGAFSAEWRAPAGPPIYLEEPIGSDAIDHEPVVQPELRPPSPLPPRPIETGLDDVDDELEWSFDDGLIRDLPLSTPPPPAPPPLPEPENGVEPFVVVEEWPEPVGGHDALQRRVRYPELARRAGIEGTVFVQFVVDEEGNVSKIECLSHPGGGTCEAAIEAVRQTQFRPGRQRNQPVPVRMTLPVRFRLN